MAGFKQKEGKKMTEWEEFIVCAGYVADAFLFYHIGVYFGERKTLEFVDKPPVLPWNAGLVARFLHNTRLDYFVQCKQKRNQIFSDDIDLTSKEIEQQKLEQEHEKMVFENRRFKVDVDEAEDDFRRWLDEQNDEQDKDRR
jgi:hypothetical protein